MRDRKHQIKTGRESETEKETLIGRETQKDRKKEIEKSRGTQALPIVQKKK